MKIVLNWRQRRDVVFVLSLSHLFQIINLPTEKKNNSLCSEENRYSMKSRRQKYDFINAK